MPPYASRALIGERLRLVFTEGTPHRAYCIRELAASTVFVALYVGAIEDAGIFLAPKHVYRMTAEQAALTGDTDRRFYAHQAMKPGFNGIGRRWYADNTREPIRDETLREGLVSVGAAIARTDLPTTSSRPRYALKADFAALFDPVMEDDVLKAAIAAFRAKHLSKGALARVSIMLAGAAKDSAALLVTLPNGETRQLAPGPSSIISQAVVEVFAKRFLDQPAVLWLSESGNKVVARDDQLANAIGLKIEADKNLPDLILVDLGPADPLIVFVEVVATDGAITVRRHAALLDLTDAAGFGREQVAFVTAYRDRDSAGFKRTISGLAWDSFAWFVSEPENILILRNGGESRALLASLLGGR